MGQLLTIIVGQPRTPGILRLPPELRLQIYADFFPPDACICAGKYLRLACRTIQTEFDAEVARHTTMQMRKSIEPGKSFIAWKALKCQSPLQISIRLSVLQICETSLRNARCMDDKPGPANSLTWRLLDGLPEYVHYVRVTFVRDVDPGEVALGEWWTWYQTSKVRSSLREACFLAVISSGAHRRWDTRDDGHGHVNDLQISALSNKIHANGIIVRLSISDVL
jgi:hypothetical protein